MLFLFGSLSFWLFISAVIIALLFMVEFEKNGFAILTIVASLITLYVFDATIFSTLLSNPLLILIGFIGYTLVGMVWSICKWFLLVKGRRDLYLEARDNFVNAWVAGGNLNNEGKMLPATAEVGLRRFLEILESRNYNWITTNSLYGMDLNRPRAKSHKSRIIGWLAYWPFSVVNTLVFDLLRDFFKHIYALLLSVYNRISNILFKDFDEDFVRLRNRELNSKTEPAAEVKKFTSGADFGT